MAASRFLGGTVASGQGEGASFTQLDWARAEFLARLGFDLFPGTLNLAPDDRAVWAEVRARPGLVIQAPDPKFCNARAYRVRIGGKIEGAVVVPEIADYPADKIEVIAAIGLRDALGLKDGDQVVLEFFD